ncbi:interleukin 17-like protein [Haliotis rufescens]|uniref:interleukin 17-like protein n=1 Tax=Haliotis rufescens TaxID=6454 RepID=UPI00201F65AC|nr:interleukin 17-like protein [Haliotis rufescens]
MIYELCVLICVGILSASALPVNDAWKHVVRQRRNAANCQPPQDINQLFQSLNANTDTSIFLRNAQGARPGSYLHSELNTDQVFDSSHLGGITCPSSVSDDPQDPLWMRSLCPWYYNVTDLPAGHYPSAIPQAVCKCDKCVDNNQNQCERVSTQIRVLEETGCENGFFIYKPKIITHFVGCTCAKRRTPTVGSNTAPTASDSESSCGDFGCAP